LSMLIYQLPVFHSAWPISSVVFRVRKFVVLYHWAHS
jgi:hypothetical protein